MPRFFWEWSKLGIRTTRDSATPVLGNAIHIYDSTVGHTEKVAIAECYSVGVAEMIVSGLNRRI